MVARARYRTGGSAGTASDYAGRIHGNASSAVLRTHGRSRCRLERSPDKRCTAYLLLYRYAQQSKVDNNLPVQRREAKHWFHASVEARASMSVSLASQIRR